MYVDRSKSYLKELTVLHMQKDTYVEVTFPKRWLGKFSFAEALFLHKSTTGLYIDRYQGTGIHRNSMVQKKEQLKSKLPCHFSMDSVAIQKYC